MDKTDSTDNKNPTPPPPDPLADHDKGIEIFTFSPKDSDREEIGLASAPPDVLPLLPPKYTYTADETTVHDLLKIDNKKQFLSVVFVEPEADEKAAREAIAAYVGDILHRLAGQATRGEPIDYEYTSQVVAEAITKARAAGINSPYIDALEEMQPPAPPPNTQPELFPDLPKDPDAETKPARMDVVTTETAQILAADARMRYPAPNYIRPEVVNIPTANLARNIHGADLAANPSGVFQYPVDKRPHSHHVFMVLLDKIGEQYPIAPIDKNILIALGNLYAQRRADGKTGMHGGAIITAADIIRLYRGYDAQTTIEDAEIQAIQERINALRNINVSFDFTQHFQYNKVGDEVDLSIPDTMRRPISESEARTAPANMIKRAEGLTVVRFSYTGHMINADAIEVEYSNGTVITAYELLTPPIVYEYAEKIRQIQQVETRLLDIRKRANSTRDMDVIKIYLLEQINAMRRDKSNRAPRILLDTLFADLRIEITSRKVKKTKVDIVKKILAHFRDTPRKNGKPLIAGFSEVIGRRRAVIGYDIQITPEEEDAKQ